MEHPHIKIIRERIQKLEAKDFDLEVWKDATRAVLEDILRPDDIRLKLIEQLKVDYGSWMLRDATAKYNPTQIAKKKGEEILHTIEAHLQSKETYLINILSKDTREAIAKGDKEKVLIAMKKEKKEILTEALALLLIK